MTTFTRKLAASVLAALGPLVAVAAVVLTQGSLPDPLPVHWNASGEVDNTQSVHSFVLVTLLIAIGCAVVAIAVLWLAQSPMAVRMFAALFTFGGYLIAGVLVVTVAAAQGHAVATDVTMPWYAIVGVIAVPALLGLAVWAVLPGHWQHALAPAQGAESTMTFAPGEHVVWIGHAHSQVLRVLVPVAAIAGAVLWFVQLSIAIPVLIVAVVLGFTCELTVRIDERGVHTLWGPLGWPRQRILLGDITGAAAQEINPMSWGGWGYRMSSRGVAAVVRGGPGLVIDREGKATYVVTVDDAQYGADVLGGLLARAQRGGAHGAR